MKENIFGSLAVISVVIGGYMFFRCIFKKQFKKGIKWALGGFIALFICVMFGFDGETAKEESKEETVKQETVKEEIDPKKKEEEEKAKIEQVKQAYQSEIRPEIDNHIKVYDDNWNNIWKPTMDAIANGSTDYYTAYNNMQVIKDNYQGGRNLIVDPVEGMDKADKDLLKTYESKMGEAFTFRVMAVEMAQDGFNTGEMSPEDVNQMQLYIQMADSSMLEAVVAITTIEVSLGIGT
jgi:hypothetical protein